MPTTRISPEMINLPSQATLKSNTKSNLEKRVEKLEEFQVIIMELLNTISDILDGAEQPDKVISKPPVRTFHGIPVE